VKAALEIFALVVIVYYVALSAIYIAFTAVAWREVTRRLRARVYKIPDENLTSPLTPAVSIVVPAYNEEVGIVQTAHSLVDLRYPDHEILIVNDGSKDATLDRLRDQFDLVPARRVLRDTVQHKRVIGTYMSRTHHNLWVLDKDNGGRADALNAGVAAAQHPYVCAIDADSLLEETALLRVTKPILDDPERVVAAGGIIRIGNGCAIDHGRVTKVGLPKNALAALQVLEYFRAFLVGRVAWARLGALLIISGAFGVFRRDLLEDVGGFWTATVAEDMELVVRLHRTLRERRMKYRIAFVPDPVCWTEAPENLRVLAKQRSRWQRGLCEALWRHRRLAFSPRYGLVGLAAYPYFLVFELLSPVISLSGFITIPLAAALGMLSLAHFLAFVIVAVLLGTLLSASALALEEFSFRRHPSGREVLRMLGLSLFENVGYRQLVDWWRLRAFWHVARRRQEWGDMQRRGIGVSVVKPPVRPGNEELSQRGVLSQATATTAGHSRGNHQPY
jgi:cellulose synthase/poly-beta-1,6-N-acetylglucosamine synthase-like glycosyltransferase